MSAAPKMAPREPRRIQDDPLSPEVVMPWMAAILDPAQHVEVRHFDSRGRASSRRFGPDERSKMVETALRLSARRREVYFTLNPLLPDTTGTASDVMVERRTLLLIDCDPVRNEAAVKAAGKGAKLSATDAEKAHAIRMGADVRAYLRSMGWPDPVEADSGNGDHSDYAVDLPNDDASRDLVKAVLVALARRFDTAEAHVDTVVYNASRITKFYGTVARKGAATEERPHRASRVLSIPEGFGGLVVTREQLLAVAELPAAAGTIPVEPEGPSIFAGKTVGPSLFAGEAVGPSLFAGKAVKAMKLKATDNRWTPEARAVAYLQKCEPAIQGEYGSNKAFKAACKIGPGFNLHPDTAFKLLWEVYNPTCDPAWSEKELRHKVADAYVRETRRGWLLEEPPKAERNGHHSTNGQEARNGDGEHSGRSTPPPGGGKKDDPPEADVSEDEYAGATEAELGILDAADVTLENPVWLWDRRFLRGNINLIAGEGGDGKTTIAILVGSVVIQGGTFPDGSPAGPPGLVMILAAEDGMGDTIKPRFIAAGADLSSGKLKFLTANVSIPKRGDRPAMVHPVCLKDLPYWRAVFRRYRPTVLIIDPLPAYLGRGVNDNKNSDVQELLKGFRALAAEFSVCVIAITHTGKATDRKLIHKVLGSVAYTNTARVVHVTIKDPNKPDVRYLERPKCNLDEPVDALAYKLVSAEFERDGETYRTSRAEIDPEPVAIDAEAMTNPKRDGARGPDPKKETAVAEWLFDFLDGQPGWTEQRHIIAEAGKEGLIGTYNPKTKKWSNFGMLYKGRKRVPELNGDRAGKRIEDQDMRTENDRYPRMCWRLIGQDSAF